MELFMGFCWYILSGYLGYSIVKCYYKISGYRWTEDDECCFSWTGLCLGYFALIGFCLWIGIILVNELLRKVHLNVF